VCEGEELALEDFLIKAVFATVFLSWEVSDLAYFAPTRISCGQTSNHVDSESEG